MTIAAATASIVPTAGATGALDRRARRDRGIGGRRRGFSISASSCAWVMANSSLPSSTVKLALGSSASCLSVLIMQVVALDAGDRADRRAGGVDDLHADTVRMAEWPPRAPEPQANELILARISRMGPFL